MDFTQEQQAAINVEVARQVAQANQQTQLAIIAQQHANAMEMQARQSKLAAIQLAQNTLIANHNNLPVDSREISPADITAYADSLVTYING